MVVIDNNPSTPIASAAPSSSLAPSSTGRAVIRIKSKKNLREAMAEGNPPAATSSTSSAALEAGSSEAPEGSK